MDFSTSAQKKITQHEIPGFALQPVVQGTKGVDWQTGISEVKRLRDRVEEGGKNRVLGIPKWKARFDWTNKKGFSLNKKDLECVYVHDEKTHKSSNTPSFSTLLQTLRDSKGIVGNKNS